MKRIALALALLQFHVEPNPARAAEPGQSVQFSNIAATTSPFSLKGGKFFQTVHASGYGTVVQLQTLAGDAVTWLNVGANLAADGVVAGQDLPPGQYRLAITGATGVFWTIAAVPY